MKSNEQGVTQQPLTRRLFRRSWLLRPVLAVTRAPGPGCAHFDVVPEMSSVIADITMKLELDGGRHCGFWTNYRPHLIHKGTEEYLGVSVVGVPETEAVLPGTTRTVEFEIMYPDLDYTRLSVGAEFEIREGSRSVGEGIVTKVLV
jgi:translation elongation factor EF-Tu-like GTPase